MPNRWTSLGIALLLGACGGGGGSTPDGRVSTIDAGGGADASRADSGGGGDIDANPNPIDGGKAADGGGADGPPPVLSLTGIDPDAASRSEDTAIVITGFDIAAG